MCVNPKRQQGIVFLRRREDPCPSPARSPLPHHLSPSLRHTQLPCHALASWPGTFACAIPSALETPGPDSRLAGAHFILVSAPMFLLRGAAPPSPQQGARHSIHPCGLSPLPLLPLSLSLGAVNGVCCIICLLLYLNLTQESTVCEGKARLLHCTILEQLLARGDSQIFAARAQSSSSDRQGQIPL